LDRSLDVGYGVEWKTPPSHIPIAENMLDHHETTIRVRYQETDAQGVLHHASIFNYFEVARVEMMRSAGHSYRELEETGVMLVVSEISSRYFLAARFDDLVVVGVTTIKAKGARIWHEYKVYRDDDLLVEGKSVVACVDATGRPKPLPKYLRTTP
jgi:acyl-CoA thioester hydrolase